MDWTFLRAGAGIVTAVGLVSSAYAAATDYAFEAVKGEIKKGDEVVVAVRLVHKSTGKPVPNAVIVRTRLDMAPTEWRKWRHHLRRCRARSLASTPSKLI
jgi:hypothetical protein